MHRLSIVARQSLILCLLLALTGLLPLAAGAKPLVQDDLADAGAPSPATGHAQVIAHGVVTLPAGEAVWTLSEGFAGGLDRRSGTFSRPPGFILAENDVVLVTDAEGLVRARVAPGEAIWLPGGAETAVIGPRKPQAHYTPISIGPANGLTDEDLVPGQILFPIAEGGTFDVDLVRDVVLRGEVSEIDSRSAPALLLLTSGRASIVSASGDVVDLVAGEFTPVEGQAVVTGASRAPAAFVLARLGSRVPERVTLREDRSPTVAPVLTTPAPTPTLAPTQAPSPAPTPTPTSTPVPTPTATPVASAVVTIASFICPVAYAGSDYAVDCTAPSTGVEFIVTRDGAPVVTAPADAAGAVAFPDLEPGEYVLAAGAPGDFASSRVRCLNVFGDDIARRAATNQIAVALEPGDDVACDWYIVPEDARGEQPEATGTISAHVRACPPGMTVETLDPDACTASPAGVSFSLFAGDVPQGVGSAADEYWWWPNLPYGAYDLMVNALPEGFTDASLGTRTCCNARGGYDVLTSAETPDTGYILYLYRSVAEASTPAVVTTPEAAPESPLELVDPDGDGLPTSDEEGFFGTDPAQADTDGDGFNDDDEIAAGTDPLDDGDW